MGIAQSCGICGKKMLKEEERYNIGIGKKKKKGCGKCFDERAAQKERWMES